MVVGYPHNQWGKFDSFVQAARFVYGDEWTEGGKAFVHWGPNGAPRLPYSYR